MKKIFYISLFLLILGCGNSENICRSDNPLCKYFEIYYPEDSILGEDVAELGEEDLITYRKLSNDFIYQNEISIFHTYSKGIFIPRFSYSLLNELKEEELYLAVAIYPVDNMNDFKDTLSVFYNDPDINFASRSRYGNCSLDENSNLDSKSSKIYNCIKDNISSYDYWVEGKEYMWKLKCVWKNPKFISVKNTIGTEYISSDLCRKSFKSFNPKVN